MKASGPFAATWGSGWGSNYGLGFGYGTGLVTPNRFVGSDLEKQAQYQRWLQEQAHQEQRAKQLADDLTRAIQSVYRMS